MPKRYKHPRPPMKCERCGKRRNCSPHWSSRRMVCVPCWDIETKALADVQPASSEGHDG